MDHEAFTQYRERWRRIRKLEAEELRAMTPEQKLELLAALMASPPPEEVSEIDRREEAEAAARWARVRKAFRG